MPVMRPRSLIRTVRFVWYPLVILLPFVIEKVTQRWAITGGGRRMPLSANATVLTLAYRPGFGRAA